MIGRLALFNTILHNSAILNNYNRATSNETAGRIPWELGIESLLFHLVGVRDTLLPKTNGKLDLKLKGRGISFRNIKLMLNYLTEKNLLTERAKENLLTNLKRDLTVKIGLLN